MRWPSLLPAKALSSLVVGQLDGVKGVWMKKGSLDTYSLSLSLCTRSTRYSQLISVLIHSHSTLEAFNSALLDSPQHTKHHVHQRRQESPAVGLQSVMPSLSLHAIHTPSCKDELLDHPLTLHGAGWMDGWMERDGSKQAQTIESHADYCTLCDAASR